MSLKTNLIEIPLPGLNAHSLLAPPYRISDLKKINYNIVNPKIAAVLILFFPSPNGQLNLVLIERSKYPGIHSGQISFPGGAVEESDETVVEAAMREANEEIGLPRQNVEVIGLLPSYRTVSRYKVAPVIGFVDPNFQPQLDANEVESAFEVPLAHLLDRRNHLVHTTHRDKRPFPIYFIPWQDKMIWGVTAAILRNLSHHIHP